METRGRKSEADREVAQLVHARDDRPEPPADLTSRQAEEWRAVVGRMPSGWFKREHYGTLAAYCRHTCRAEDVEKELASASLATDLERYEKLARAAERETRSLIAAARTLRITHQSQYDEKKAHRTVQNQGGGGKPWD